MKGQKGFVLVSRLPQQPAFSLKAALRSAITHVLRWAELARQRQQLASMSDMALKDLGLSRADIFEESGRPFWDDPLRK